MKWLMRACSTTVGKKYLMAVTGLLLCGFLVVHLSGNLLLYVGQDGEAYNKYAHTLHSQEGLLKVAEVGLIVLFGSHIWLALQVSRDNRAARNVSYAARESKIAGRLSPVKAETFMLISGLVILGFLILHLADFTFLLRHDADWYKTYEGNEFAKAKALLTDPLTGVVYTVGCTLLGIHLAHGIASAFQSLGLNNPKYESMIRWIGVIVAAILGVGFVSFPIIYFLQGS